MVSGRTLSAVLISTPNSGPDTRPPSRSSHILTPRLAGKREKNKKAEQYENEYGELQVHFTSLTQRKPVKRSSPLVEA